jgi:hypothetical protein
LRSAEWLWRLRVASAEPGRQNWPQLPAPDDEVKGRFGAALTEAVLYGDAESKEAATRWFQGLGIPVPEPDLEGEEGGG